MIALSPGPRTRAALAVAAALGLAAGLTACDPGTPRPSGGTSVPEKGQLHGTDLAGLLLPPSALPKGLKPNADGTRNSADAVRPPSRTPVPRAAACRMLDTTAWIDAAGIGSATFAQSDAVNAAHTEEVAQGIDTFRAGDAGRVITGLYRVLAHCARFTDTYGGNTAHVRLARSRVHANGADGVKAVLTAPEWEGGATLVALRGGDAVVTVQYDYGHAGRGAAAVRWAGRIAAKVRAAG